MEVVSRSIDHKADLYEVKDALAKVLHSPKFDALRPGNKVINFNVRLNLNEKIETRNTGTGHLIVPTVEIGNKLLQLVKEARWKVLVRGRPISLDRSRHGKPPQGLVETLLKLPYLDPALDREKDDKLRSLNVRFRVDEIQFGIWGVRPSPSQHTRGVFCNEWTRRYVADTLAQLWFDYDHKLLRIRLGDPARDVEAHSIVIRFSTIRNLWCGNDFGNHFLCFDLLTPAIFESECFHRSLTGVGHQDRKKYRKRIRAIDDDHARISPYAHHIRLTLYEEADLINFIRLCDVVSLKAPISADIDSEGHGFFTGKQLLRLNRALESMPWSSAFQIQALLHNGLITTIDLRFEGQLWIEIVRLCREQPLVAGKVLRAFHEELMLGRWSPFHPQNEQLHLLFMRIQSALLSTPSAQLQEARPGGAMDCYHITFTPTRMSLEGPYAIQSNRVIRQYAPFVENFIRVDFRDEDRLQYRFEFEVDGEEFVQEQVGGILKKGFSLAGRHFEFLGYSSSSLREHSMWFVHPFEHPQQGVVNASLIRRSLGDFSGDILRPAKYAARLGQAFTATNPSISIRAKERKIVRDMGFRPYQHTDGVGTISRELANLIWEKTGSEKKIMPSVVRITIETWQIRFLGFKGVVSIDDELQGRRMHLRASMQKFRVHKEDPADIEIAQEFCFPNTMYLNRQLIMILEGRGIPAEAFLALQAAKLTDVLSSSDDTAKLCKLLKAHSLGVKFGLVPMFRRLLKLGIGLEESTPSKCLDNPFFDRAINCAVDSVLRDIKYRARIPVPDSWHLVGVVDEGPAYIAQDPRYTWTNTYTLRVAQIYACIQTDLDSEPIFLHGDCLIGRSPTVHPGDVQRVWAVGRPPDDKICLFRNLKNCVVLPCVGKRSLASYLGGGDVDGDMFQIIQHTPLFPSDHQDPAEYPPVDTMKIKEEALINPETGERDEERIIDHVCDFIVDYINSDILGLLSDKHLIRAGFEQDGIFDHGCLLLAKLCSQAVDYPKNGIPVKPKAAPPPLIRYRPDWKEGEVENARPTDFYESDRAIGKLFRAVNLVRRQETPRVLRPSSPLIRNPIYIALMPLVSQMIGKESAHGPHTEDVPALFKYYVGELRYICLTHTLTDHSGVQLSEAEVVVGTISANCSGPQRRWRQERIYRMGYHVGNLIQEIRGKLSTSVGETEGIIDLEKAWVAWIWTMSELETALDTFGLHSFGIICLNAVLDRVDPILSP
ncbi:RdRP-domain-containing protein [Schizopora paradoxa]|uniref:RNA-dependent RNA polymerase n=1 Tax=Schizopora paradoxa TaxID=27342 RepID=A0A0H2S5G5_9AGAM|nr:RdRP-domain-containing protein [Schizopora paradoxa]